MNIYGADFSGARDASRGIYYAEGSLEDGSMTINRVVHCDDRLDLLAAIHLSKAPWGLYSRDGLEDDWEKRYKWINDVEWKQRSIEGLIVKVE